MQPDTKAPNNSSSMPPITVNTQTTISTNPKTPPDLVDLKVKNPIIYIKYWWSRIMSNDGIELRFKAKPLTVFGVALIAFSLAFGLGGVVLPVAFPWFKVNSVAVVVSPTPTPTPNPWKDTAVKGTLQKTNTIPVKFYLFTSSDEAITLEVSANINLLPLVGRRILAIGSYSSKDKIIKVTDVQDLEVLSASPVPIPVTTPIPTSSNP